MISHSQIASAVTLQKTETRAAQPPVRSSSAAERAPPLHAICISFDFESSQFLSSVKLKSKKSTTSKRKSSIARLNYSSFFRANLSMLEIKTAKTHKGKRELEKRAPKLVESGKKTLILHGTKTSSVLNAVLSEIYHLKKGTAIKYSRKNENIKPFESGGETSLEFFSLKTDCSIFVYGSHSKKRPDNLVVGRTYDHHIYDLIEVGVENFKPSSSFDYDKKLAPKEGSKPFITFIGEGFESVEELKHLKEVLLDLLHGEVVESLNLAGLDRVYVCSAVSSNRVFLTHCALRLKKSGTIVPRMELVEVGPSLDLIVRRHRLPNDSVRKEAIKTTRDKPKKKEKNVKKDALQGKIGQVYIPDQKIGEMALPNKAKGVKRERREAKMKIGGDEHASKRKKDDS